MNALVIESEAGRQHRHWLEARRRLTVAADPPPKPRRFNPTSPFHPDRVSSEARAKLGRRRLFLEAIVEIDNAGRPVIPHVFGALWRSIALEVSIKHDVSVLDMQSARRDRPTVYARHEVFYRLRNETMLSLPQIGKKFGNRDHTTVIHGVNAHARRLLEALTAGAKERADG